MVNPQKTLEQPQEMSGKTCPGFYYKDLEAPHLKHQFQVDGHQISNPFIPPIHMEFLEPTSSLFCAHVCPMTDTSIIQDYCHGGTQMLKNEHDMILWEQVLFVEEKVQKKT